MRRMTMRLALVTEIIAPYRIPVFNELANHPEIDLNVIFLAETDPSLRQWQVYKDEIRFDYEVLPSWRRRIGQYKVLLNTGVGRCLRAFSPDAVVCGGYNYLAAWNIALWTQHNNVPLLLWCESTARDTRRNYRSVELLKAKFLGQCDGFIVPGKSSAEYLRQLGIREHSVFTAPNAVDNAFFTAAADQSRLDPGLRRKLGLPERYFLYSGRLVTEKGIFDLLSAYAKLKDQLREEVGLVFAGDGPQKSQLMESAGSLPSGMVKFPGFQQREGLAQLYALADVLILPTHTDPWGLVVNEAMACGLPIIATQVAGCAADLVREGVNGFVVPAHDQDELAAAMTTLAADPDLVRCMGHQSSRMIRDFSPQACAGGIAQAALSTLQVAA
jgi:glycosyltransferase involved in cell wall biosynthesis